MPKKESMVSTLWRNMTFRCGHSVAKDGKERTCKAIPVQKMIHDLPCLQCPVCGTVVTFWEIEKIVAKISDEIVKDAEDGIEANMTNERFSYINPKNYRTTTAIITKDNGGKLELSVDSTGQYNQ